MMGWTEFIGNKDLSWGTSVFNYITNTRLSAKYLRTCLLKKNQVEGEKDVYKKVKKKAFLGFYCGFLL